jgi:hypothetical protein
VNCRFGLKQPDSELLEIPPGASEIPCELLVRGPGEFSSQLHLFVDDHGAREIIFTIQGTATGEAGP